MLFHLRGLRVCGVYNIFVKKFPSRFFANAKNMECNDLSAGFITCPNHETAKALARGMVEKNLVACVNIIPNITSIYAWENKVEEDSEFMLLIKTRSTRIPDVTDYIKKNHPYDVPEVISFKIDQGNPGYLDFVRTNTVENPQKSET